VREDLDAIPMMVMPGTAVGRPMSGRLPIVSDFGLDHQCRLENHNPRPLVSSLRSEPGPGIEVGHRQICTAGPPDVQRQNLAAPREQKLEGGETGVAEA